MISRRGSNLLCVLLILFFINVLSVSASQDNDGKDLFQKFCNRCHTYYRALKTYKDKSSWEKTVKRMSGKIFNLIKEDEIKKIAEYLVKTQKGKKQEKEADDKKIEEIEDDGFDFKKVKVEDFISPEVCKKCHTEIYNQWKGSMHSKAFLDPIWQGVTKLFFKEIIEEKDVLEMKTCIKCHTPLGFRSYSFTSPADDFTELTDLPAQGIFCNWCHNISEVNHIRDAKYEVSPGGGPDDPGRMLGPRKDSYSDFHPSKYSELHTRSEFCGLCHNVTHAVNGIPLEQTYEEWKNSPYNTGDPETSVHCQDCHMRQLPGVPVTGKTKLPNNPGKSANEGPVREHIWTHYFVGGNALVPRLMGGEVNSNMAIERLVNAADLEIIKDVDFKTGQVSELKIKVTNSGAGHYLPTGLTEIREMWLYVMITDNQGNTIFSSGTLDQRERISKKSVIYNTVLGDKKGKPVINVALADRILSDHRIPPKGFMIEKYSFEIPEEAMPPLKIEAVLKYRSISPDLLGKLLETSPEVPVIDMARDFALIDFKKGKAKKPKIKEQLEEQE